MPLKAHLHGLARKRGCMAYMSHFWEKLTSCDLDLWFFFC